MTREQAKNIRKAIDDKISSNTVDMEGWAEFWGFTEDEYDEFLDMAIKALEQEQEEIIRCRECKYCELHFIWVCKYRNKAVKPDGFCERGERK